MAPSSDVVHAFFTKKTIRHISPSEKERSKEENQEKEANSLKRKRIDHLETGEKEITVQDDNSLLVLEFTFIHPSWLIYLKEELKLPYFSNLKRFLTQEKLQGKCIFPPDELIYSWSQLCPLDRVRVVILGQDPYHNIHQAMGLCFSVPKGIKAPPSLINIYKELSSDERIKSKTGTGKFQIPNTGDLTSWAKQGVLLLNTSLTVRAHEAASHADHGWEKFTDKIIEIVHKNRKNVVFLLWGSHAQKKCRYINDKNHKILLAPHPSPLSAHRGFIGCRHFSLANDYLIETGQDPIDWTDL